MLSILGLKPNTPLDSWLENLNAPTICSSRRGFGVLAGENCMSEASMPPTRIIQRTSSRSMQNPLMLHPEANVLAWIEPPKALNYSGVEAFLMLRRQR